MEMRNTTVTILLAFYNEKKYMMKAVESVVKQTYPYWQLLLLDDGSTDETLQYVHARIKDKRIVYKKYPYNRGKGKVLNEGLKLAAGDYIMELDADDWLVSDALLSLVTYIEELPTDVALVYSDYITVKKNRTNILQKKVRLKSIEHRLDLVSDFFVPTPRFYRREALVNIGGWPTDYPSEGRLYEDVAVIFQLLKEYKMAHLAKYTMYVRKRKGSITTTNRLAWYTFYKYLLAKSLIEWGEPYLIEVDEKNSIYVKYKREAEEIEKPLVSIAVHFQNHAATILYVIQSILNQTYSSIEIVFINDHSSDETLSIIKRLMENRKNPYRIITLKNETGEGKAYQQAIQEASGKYFLYTTPHELLNPETIETLVYLLDENEHQSIPLVGAYGNRKLFLSFPRFQFYKNEKFISIMNRKQLLDCKVVPKVILFNLDFLKKADTSIQYFSEGKYFFDYLLLAKTIEGGSFIHISKFLSFHIASEVKETIYKEYLPVFKVIKEKISRNIV